MDEFEQIIAASYTQAEADETTIRVFRDPATWEGVRVKSLARSLFVDAIITVRAAEGREQ